MIELNDKLYLVQMTEKYVAYSQYDDKCLYEGRKFIVSKYSESSYKLVNEYNMYVPKEYCKILKEYD
ncbi:hypothetical protein [uncultured Clostridium sp.]|jgi:hypothetical protein|uniref:hypothetical protein n=1 Tax=uncultured Clostridium sp. TaxID=59620 RepID=UPI0032173B73